MSQVMRTRASIVLFALLVAACHRSEPADVKEDAARQLEQRHLTAPAALYRGIKQGDAELTALAIRAGYPDLKRKYDRKVDHGPTWLAQAAAAGSLPVLQQIIDAGAPVDDHGEYGMTALHWAALEGHDDVVKVLLQHEARVDLQDEAGWTALMFAAGEGHESTTAVLLANRASPNISTNRGWNALRAASVRHHDSCVALLQRAGGTMAAPPRNVIMNEIQFDPPLLDFGTFEQGETKTADVTFTMLKSGYTRQVNFPNTRQFRVFTAHPVSFAMTAGQPVTVHFTLGPVLSVGDHDGGAQLDLETPQGNVTVGEIPTRFRVTSTKVPWDAIEPQWNAGSVMPGDPVRGSFAFHMRQDLEEAAEIHVTAPQGFTAIPDLSRADANVWMAVFLFASPLLRPGPYSGTLTIESGKHSQSVAVTGNVLPRLTAKPVTITRPATFQEIDLADAGDVVAIHRLLASGVDPKSQSQGNSFTFAAVHGRSASVLRLLLEAGASPDEKNSSGHSLVDSATQGCNAGVLKTLIDHGATTGGKMVNIQDGVVAKNGCEAAAEIVLAGGKNPAKQAVPYGTTSLAEAALRGDTVGAEYFLKSGSVDSPDSDGVTALMIAAGNAKPGVVRLLIESGADVNAINKAGNRTPLEDAHACSDCADLLMAAGARRVGRP